MLDFLMISCFRKFSQSFTLPHSHSLSAHGKPFNFITFFCITPGVKRLLSIALKIKREAERRWSEHSVNKVNKRPGSSGSKRVIQRGAPLELKSRVPTQLQSQCLVSVKAVFSLLLCFYCAEATRVTKHRMKH